jgi:hypothetical protein
MLKIAIVLASLSWLPLSACADTHKWVEKERPYTRETVSPKDRVQIRRTDGSLLALDHARIDADEQGEFIAGKEHAPEPREVRVELADVQDLEVWEKDPGNIPATIAAGLVVLGAIVLYLLHGSSTHY